VLFVMRRSRAIVDRAGWSRRVIVLNWCGGANLVSEVQSSERSLRMAGRKGNRGFPGRLTKAVVWAALIFFGPHIRISYTGRHQQSD
jgi:hypothetical protein